MVTIKIKATIKKTELSEKLTAADIHVSDVDGDSLFGAAITRIEQNKASGDVIKNAFKDYPSNVLEIKRVGNPDYDERQKKWIIKVEISVNREKYRTFIKTILPVLKKVATNTKRITITSTPSQGYLNLDYRQRDILNKDWRFLICTQINEARTTTIWENFDVPEEAVKAAMNTIRRPTFTVDIVDNRKDVITTGTYNMPVPYLLWGKRTGQRSPCLIIPVLCDPNDVNWALQPGTDKATFNLAFDVSPNEFKRMKNVVCRIDKE